MILVERWRTEPEQIQVSTNNPVQPAYTYLFEVRGNIAHLIKKTRTVRRQSRNWIEQIDGFQNADISQSVRDKIRAKYTDITGFSVQKKAVIN